MTLPEWMYFNAWQPQNGHKLPDALREHNGRSMQNPHHLEDLVGDVFHMYWLKP